MRKILLSVCLYMLAACLFSNLADAHPQFPKALKEKYGYRLVSCYTCHVSASEAKSFSPEDQAKYKKNSKHFRNAFGKVIEPQVEGMKMEERAGKSAALKKEARDAGEAQAAKLKAQAEEIDAGMMADFLKALDKVTPMKDADTGKTYGELLKSGELHGVSYPKE